MNPRYQKYTEPKGQTRKSAAAAKPKKSATAAKPAAPAKGTKPRSTYVGNPDTPEYKALRRQWWIALGIGLVFALAGIAVESFAKTASWSRTAQFVTIAIAYGCIGYAIFIDWTKLRVMRKEWMERGGKPAKPAKSDEKTAEKTDAK